MEQVYVYTQYEKMRNLRDQVIDLLQDGKPTILVGHSFGGIIATAVTHQAHQMGFRNVIRLVTLATPHTMNLPAAVNKLPTKTQEILDLEQARQAVGYKHEPLDIPVYTQGARFDHVVPRQFTHYVGETKHIDVLSTHSGFWLNPRSWRYRGMWNDLRD